MNNTMINNFFNKGDMYMKNAVRAQKKLLRERTKEKIQALTSEYIEEASDKIVDQILASEEYQKARTIFCYRNFGKEVVTDRLIEQALADGKTVGIPLCLADRQMEVKKYTASSELVPGPYGIREPAPDAETIDPSEIDLGIIPCMTMDARGNRLGHGAGYYDRYLAKAGFYKMGVCFTQIMATNVATDSDDIRMDEVVTEEQRHIIR